MTFAGYAGQILYVDLTARNIKKEALTDEDITAFLGGAGINYRLAAQVMKPTMDPFSADNVIILGSGVFSGTIIPSSAKLLATTKFPVNNAIGSGTAGGRFPIMMKSSGYDHIVISGRAAQPVCIKIRDDEVLLEDAGDLWGKDIVETTSALVGKYEPCSVICIGPAGENYLKISLAFMDGTGHLGTGGLAAVMGSKNLKAIVVCQGNHPVTVADPFKLRKIVKGLTDRQRKWPGRRQLIDGGMAGVSLESWMEEPRVLDNWTRADFRDSQDEKELEQFARRHMECRQGIACPSCTMSCKERVEVKTGPHAGTVTYGHLIFPFWGKAKEYGRSVKFISELNRYGVCRNDFGALLYLVAYLQDQAVLTEKQVGFRVKEDDLEGALRLLEMTVYRRGFGDVLAEGLMGLGQEFPDVRKYLVQIKGRSPPFSSHAYDPRVKGLGTMEFSMMTHPRGAHISAGGSPAFTPGRTAADFARHADRMGVSAEAVRRVAPEKTGFNPGRYSRYSQDWTSLFDCVGLCNRHFVNRFFNVNTITELYNAITGRKMDPAGMMKVAERSWNLCRLLNVQAGFTRREDQPPAIWFTRLKGGEKDLVAHDYYGTMTMNPADFETALDEYYSERGWDPKTGIPTREKIMELGLESYASGMKIDS
jgi:aldehyde:ferredoxin oxidoreductase